MNTRLSETGYFNRSICGLRETRHLTDKIEALVRGKTAQNQDPERLAGKNLFEARSDRVWINRLGQTCRNERQVRGEAAGA